MVALSTPSSELGWRTEEIKGPMTMVGLTWSDSSPESIQVRWRRSGEGWQPWTPLGISDHAPDARSSESGLQGTEALWIGEADAAQFRVVGGAPRGLLASIVDTTNRTKPFLRRLGDMFRPATAGAQPPINARSTWDPDNSCEPRVPANLSEVRTAFVHHTVNPNSYSSGNVPSMLLATCLFHTQSRDFDDIAYNFIVDRFGVVWEGRAGGIALPVQGAHTKGFNSQSTGIAALGTFSSSNVPAAMETSIAELIAWKLPLHRVEPNTTALLFSGENEIFEEDTLVEFNTVSGHRDAQSTSCPGGSLYSRLPNIRTAAAALAEPVPPHPGVSDTDEIIAYHPAGGIRMGAFDAATETLIFSTLR